MSFLVGPVSGALVVGGVYYGFSTMIRNSTQQHRLDLHRLSERLIVAQSDIPAPIPASQRITHHPFASLLKKEWNAHVETLFHTAGHWDQRAMEWGRRLLYGGDAESPRKS